MRCNLRLDQSDSSLGERNDLWDSRKIYICTSNIQMILLFATVTKKKAFLEPSASNGNETRH